MAKRAEEIEDTDDAILTSVALAEVKYEIRGQLAHRAHEMERLGYEVISLNIGNPGLFGFRTLFMKCSQESTHCSVSTVRAVQLRYMLQQTS